MPYNIPDKYGGDSPKNTQWMEECINAIDGINKRTGKPYTKGEKIAICKAMLMKSKSRESAEQEINAKLNLCVRKLMRTKNTTFNQAFNEVKSLAEKFNYDFDRIWLALGE
jgi:hypothetical protein